MCAQVVPLCVLLYKSKYREIFQILTPTLPTKKLESSLKLELFGKNR